MVEYRIEIRWKPALGTIRGEIPVDAIDSSGSCTMPRFWGSARLVQMEMTDRGPIPREIQSPPYKIDAATFAEAWDKFQSTFQALQDAANKPKVEIASDMPQVDVVGAARDLIVERKARNGKH